YSATDRPGSAGIQAILGITALPAILPVSRAALESFRNRCDSRPRGRRASRTERETQMIHKGSRLAARLLGAAAMVALVGTAANADMLTEIGEGEGVVDIVAWPGYIERGETDPAFDWVTDFEAATGCEVRIKTANTSDEMV